MSNYKGFITQQKYIELTSLLRNIVDTQGMENRLHHLYQPDTDMNDKICDDLLSSQTSIMADIIIMINQLKDLSNRVAKIKEGC